MPSTKVKNSITLDWPKLLTNREIRKTKSILGVSGLCSMVYPPSGAVVLKVN